jgi:hypothetical protein
VTIAFLDEGATVQVQPNSRAPFTVTADGAGVVGHAGVALLCELADRLELTKALAWHAGRHPARRHRHQAGRDRSCPPRTSGFRCRADPARTSATTS